MYTSSGLRSQRVAILVSPRTGNTWLRRMLVSACDLQSFAVNNPDEFDWANAPSNCVVSMHWHPTNQLLQILKRESFQVVTIFRHPLDTLLSILQFTCRNPTHRWLEGEAGSEQSIFGVMPRSDAFINYAASRRAEALLSVSGEWARVPGVNQVGYEALVNDTRGEMNRLLETLGLVMRRSLDSVIEENSMSRTMSPDHPLYLHSWQGKPNHWKKLLTTIEANAIAEHLQLFFGDGRYQCDPDDSLTPGQADANWVALCGTKLVESSRQEPIYKQEIEQYKLKLACATKECADLKQSILRETRGIRRIKSLIRSAANLFVPFDRHRDHQRAA